jgi:hypothetical protein
MNKCDNTRTLPGAQVCLRYNMIMKMRGDGAGNVQTLLRGRTVYLEIDF